MLEGGGGDLQPFRQAVDAVVGGDVRAQHGREPQPGTGQPYAQPAPPPVARRAAAGRQQPQRQHGRRGREQPDPFLPRGPVRAADEAEQQPARRDCCEAPAAEQGGDQQAEHGQRQADVHAFPHHARQLHRPEHGAEGQCGEQQGARGAPPFAAHHEDGDQGGGQEVDGLLGQLQRDPGQEGAQDEQRIERALDQRRVVERAEPLPGADVARQPHEQRVVQPRVADGVDREAAAHHQAEHRHRQPHDPAAGTEPEGRRGRRGRQDHGASAPRRIRRHRGRGRSRQSPGQPAGGHSIDAVRASS